MTDPLPTRYIGRLARLTLIALAGMIFLVAQAAIADRIVLQAGEFQRHHLYDPSDAQRIRTARNLSNAPVGPVGWAEYAFQVKSAGWYQIIVHGVDNGVEYMIDPQDDSLRASGTQFFGATISGAQRQQIGNVWLAVGNHHLRVQHLQWNGFPPISAIEFKPSGQSLAGTLAILPADDRRIFRTGQCGGIDFLGGGTGIASKYQVFELESGSHANRRIYDIAFPSTEEPTRLRFDLPCSAEGLYTLAVGNNDHPIDSLGSYSYEVIDTHVPTIELESAEELVREIDCASQAPDFNSGGSRIIKKSFGTYRESDDHGWVRFQKLAPNVMRNAPQPGWFAYKFDGLIPQQRYRVETDYPDDKRRTFAIVLREAAPLTYPPSIGVTGGGEYSLSNATATQAMTVWPRTRFPRLLFITAHDGEPAACTKIRIYKQTRLKPLVPQGVANSSRRQIVHWYEEGGNYESLFGPPDNDPGTSHLAAERWFETALANGVNLLIPTAVVYGQSLYPTTHEITGYRPGVDDLRRLVLLAEKCGIKLAAEIHPRGDELSWGYEFGKPTPDNLLVSKDGKTNFFAGDGKTRNFPPYFDPLDPRVQAWYLDLIGEIADRYRDSPAFDGVSLRYMQWSNGSYNNLVSLDWGYGDRTVAQFKHETGLPVPLGKAEDPHRFAVRYQWLTTTGHEAWIAWRCRKITDLMVRARDRLRQARPDLKLYMHIFNADGNMPDPPSFAGGQNTKLDRLKAAGIDPELLRGIDGLVPIDASYAYGRHAPDNVYLGNHDHLLDPDALAVLRGPEPGHFIYGMHYLEATEVVVPPEQLGFSPLTKATWMSAPANPAGRHALERYAIPLAETDAMMLGDGGNGYTFSPPVLREFLKEFALLPNRPFTSRSDAVDPVTVRTLATDAGMLFYAVNRERYAMKTEIVLNKTGTAIRLSTGIVMPSSGKTLTLELKPYELIVARLDPGLEITAVSNKAPSAERRLVENRLAWVQLLAAGKHLTSRTDKTTVDAAVATAAAALKQGRLWRARTVLEHNTLLAIYRRLDCYPPQLFNDLPAQHHCDPDAIVTKR